MPGRSIPKIMERKKNKAKIRNQTKTERACCEEEKRGNLDEMGIIAKGKWETIQKEIWENTQQ